MAVVDLETVARIMREVADEVILPRWRNLAAGEITRKDKAGGLVTIADHEAEARLEAALQPLLPGSVVVGEEAVAADPAVLDVFRGSAPVWVLDPIDGTRAFTEGRPIFDVMVALVRDGRPVAGWIYAPADRDLYMGAVGEGAVRAQGDASPEALPARGPKALAELEGIVTPGPFRQRGLPDPAGLVDRFRGFVRHTCAGHNYARLIRGDSDFLINFSTHPWDHLPGLAITAALGFAQARRDGAPFDPLDREGGILVAPDEATWRDIHALLLTPAGTGRGA